MGLDGFSISDLRIHKEVTSAQMSNDAERFASEGSDVQIKDVGSMAKDSEIKRKEDSDEEEKDNRKEKKGEDFEDFFEESTEDTVKPTQFIDVEKEEDFVDPLEGKNINDYAVRINPKTEIIELYNKNDKKVLETITAEELMNLIVKLNSASGILVNKKI